MSVKCVVHYQGIGAQDDNLLPLTREKYDRLLEAKNARERLSGANSHEPQGRGIPVAFDECYTCHQSCYKKYTMAISVFKKKGRKIEMETPPSTRKKRCEIVAPTAILFPKHCMHPKCLSPNVIKHGGERQMPAPLVTKNACQSVLDAASILGDEEMLTKIRGQDLIAREFLMHRKCFRDYTRNISSNRRPTTSVDATEADIQPNPDKLQELKQFVQENIIDNGRSVSLRLLTELYGFDPDDSRRRGKVKEKLQTLFPDQLLYVTVDYHSVQIVISLTSVTNVDAKGFVKNNDRMCFDRVSGVLQREMDEVIGNAETLPWPPTTEALRRQDRKAPGHLIDFILDVLHNKKYHHVPGTEIKRFADSVAQDIIFCYSGGSFFTEKHVMLGTGLHSLTGQKIPVSILARFGHCIKYDTIRAIEAGQAELARKLSEDGYELPLIPKTDQDIVHTIFWWDNYDEYKENQSGGIHTTHGIGWQESGEGAVARPSVPSTDVQRSRGYHAQATTLPACKINPHVPPPTFPSTPPSSQLAARENERELFLWKTMRKYHGLSNQIIPRFIGHIIERYANPMHPKTYMTFLPPIMRPITDYGTITECIYQSQRMAEHCNLKYVQIVADVGAASKFLHVVWNNPITLKNVIIHLGDMHAFMENFSVVGKFVEGSGFDEIVFQSGEAHTGTIRGILSGKHYNRAWTTHEAFAEAIDRFFVIAYMSEEMRQITEFISALPDQTDIRRALLQSGILDEVHQKYSSLKTECLNGCMGATPRYWMMYVDMIDRQLVMHSAINLNDFDARLRCWQEFLPFYFSMNKTNYARYGSYYCQQMMNLDHTHPGAREEISTVSVCRNDDGIGQSIDAGGEQTFMRSAKTAGGLRNLSNRPDSYEKWVRNRPYAAQMVEALIQLADMDIAANPRKSLRPSQIKKSENTVKNIMQTITQYFVMPFDKSLNPANLFNLVSGKPLEQTAADTLLSCHKRGAKQLEQFSERLTGKDGASAFFDPISRVPWKSFKDGVVKSTVKSKSGKVKDIALQRHILGILAAKSTEMEKPIDFRATLSYPLAPVPLSLASSDGMQRKTVKSKLMDALQIPSSDQPPPDNNIVYILDVIAQIRAMVNVPDTFRLLARRLLNDIPARYKTVYLACDRYDCASIKNAEHALRADHRNTTEYNVSKPDMKIPDFSTFMKNSSNKQQMMERIKDVLVEERGNQGDRVVYYTTGSKCLKITGNGVIAVNSLSTDHMEADTMIAYLAKHAANCNSGQKTVCLVRSPSGDVDIPVVLLNIQHENLKIYIDNGTGKSRKVLNICESSMSPTQKKAVTGFHALTGNDYNSAFFYKGKLNLWEKIKDDENILESFCRLGTEPEVSHNLQNELEKIVCLFYGQKKCNSVNEARYKIFWSNYKRGKIIDLCFLPPCRSSLVLHCMRANYIARMWRLSDLPILSLPPVSESGWMGDFRIKWVEIPYPKEISELLIETDDESDVESEQANAIYDDIMYDETESYSIEDFADQVSDDLW